MAVSVQQGLGGTMPGSPAPFAASAGLLFESVEAFQSAFAPHAADMMADIPKYTTIQPMIQISEVKI